MRLVARLVSLYPISPNQQRSEQSMYHPPNSETLQGTGLKLGLFMGLADGGCNGLLVSANLTPLHWQPRVEQMISPCRSQ